jgi:hypothetical protein
VDPLEMLAEVKSAASLDEAYHLTTFKAYRASAAGNLSEVTIQILDGGPEMGERRYTVMVQDDKGRRVSGTARPTVRAALQSVPWFPIEDRRTP